MHVFRTGSSVRDLGAVDPALIGYIQLCDVPLVPQIADYAYESVHERLPPGTGDLPLRDALGVLPRDVTVGIEIPQLSLAEAGIAPREQLVGILAVTRSLLGHIDS